MRGLSIKLNYWVQNAIVQWTQKLLYRPLKERPPQKILILRGGSLGDNICALPALSTIRKTFPNAHIRLLTNSRGADLVSLQTLLPSHVVDQVINLFSMSWQEKLSLFQGIRSEQFDLLIEIPENLVPLKAELRNMVLGKFLGIPSGFGWQIAATKLFKKEQANTLSFPQETHRLLQLLAKNGIEETVPEYPLEFTREQESHVSEFLRERKISNRLKTIALVVGAKRSANQWPIAYFTEVVQYLLTQGFQLLLIGGRAEQGLASQLELSPNVHNCCGAFSPLESGLLLRSSCLTISNDTGPMHLSYAVGTPVVAIFSARDYPQKWFPPNDGQNIVFRDDNISCSPCFLDDCPRENECLTRIAPSQIIDELKKRGI